ncbi:MAG: PAS domain-containing sensor histidine kinase [Nitrospira sp.]|nr:MAG: PAS domain-containing sensor histidine kinase [Nitrospira sp.]
MRLELPRFRFISLQARFLLGTVLVLLLVMAAVIVVVEHRQRAAIIDEVERRGEVIAGNLAAVSRVPLLLYNFTALEQNVARVAGEADVVYAIILDAEGKVATHSRHPELAGVALRGAADELAVKTDTFLVQETVQSDTRESIYDFVVPVIIEGQRWGTVRIGISKRRMEAEIRKTRWELGALTLVTLVLGGVLAALVARRIARPVRELAEGAAAISRGELNQQIVPSTADEIGQLAIAFNHMASQLFQQRTSLETAHADLRSHFEELADLKSYTDSILESLTSGIITLDLDGRVVTMNAAAELLTGLFAAEATGRYCTEIFSHSPEVVEILMESLASRAGVASTSLMLGRRNASALPIELSTAPLAGADGKDLGVVGVFKDVTVVHELEAQVRRSDRLAALGTLAAGFAHEIKNPITSLRTFTRLVSRKFNDERFRQTFERVVPRELERINELVERLLELARPTQLNLKPVQLPGLIERVLELYANQIETKQITVLREYAHDLPTIRGDAERIYQAFLNLVANALEAMGTGGRLTLRAGWSDDRDWLPSSRRAPERSVKVEIGDTGTGIPSSETDKIFNPFFTTKEGGTGLGLALVHKIIEDHGGSITFRSSAGVGTTFRLLLPVLGERRAERKSTHAS